MVNDVMDGPMQSEQRDANAEIIERLEWIEAGVKATNGRVTALEQWRSDHQPMSEKTRVLIQEQSAKLDVMGNRVTEILLALPDATKSVERAIEQALDQRQTTENAAKYAALVRRFGSDPEESLNRWAGLQSGVRAIGWKVAGTVVVILAIALLAALFSIWAVSLQGAS